MGPPILRGQRKFLWPLGPRYDIFLGGVTGADIATVLRKVEDGSLKIVVDEKGPFPFTEEGVKAAWDLPESRHAHGKVVVQIEAENAKA